MDLITLSESNKIFSLIIKGGIIVIPIFLLSIVAFYIFLERFLFLRRSNILMSEDKMLLVKNKIEKNELDSIEEVFNLSDEIFRNVLLSGIREYKRKNSTSLEVENAIIFSLKKESQKLDKGLDTISNIYNLAPMVGFLGTVIGMINAFMAIASSKESIISVKIMASGIYESLITTVAGLVVSIATSIMHNFLAAKIKKLENEMEIYANSFITFLKKNK